MSEPLAPIPDKQLAIWEDELERGLALFPSESARLLAEVRRQRMVGRQRSALLRECHKTIWDGCAGPDGSPCRSDLIPLLRRIEEAFPDLLPAPSESGDHAAQHPVADHEHDQGRQP